MTPSNWSTNRPATRRARFRLVSTTTFAAFIPILVGCTDSGSFGSPPGSLSAASTGVVFSGAKYPVPGSFPLLEDLDGDGMLDLVTFSLKLDFGQLFAANAIYVTLQDPPGRIFRTQTIQLAFAPQFGAIADLYGDGYPDLITSNAPVAPGANSTLAFFVSAPAGPFQDVVLRDLPFPAGAIAAHDVTLDGHPDILVASMHGEFATLRNDGDGAFAPADAVPMTAEIPVDVDIGDLNGDSLPDAVVTSAGASDLFVTILIADAPGSYRQNQSFRISFSLQSGFPQCALGDIDADGFTDIAVAAPTRRHPLTFFLNNGSGQFEGPQVALLDDSDGLSGVGFGDFNADGFTDLLAAEMSWDELASHIFMPGSPVGIRPGNAELATGLPNGGPITVADVDQDGIDDAVVGSHLGRNPRPPWIFFGRPESPHLLNQAFDLRPASPTDFAVLDVNNDGLLDLAVSDLINDSLIAFLRGPDSRYSMDSIHAVGFGPLVILTGDLNRDGFTDIVTVNGLGGNTVSVLLGSATDGLGFAVDFPVGGSPTAAALADFNGDGYPDLATLNSSTLDVSVLIGDGEGGFMPQVRYVTNPTGKIDIRDIDQDGALDIVTLSRRDSLTVLPGIGDGSFRSAITTSIRPDDNQQFLIDDFDGDGVDDAIIRSMFSFTSRLDLHRGNGDGSFLDVNSAEEIPVVTAQPNLVWTIIADDFDRDGLPDLAAGLSEACLFCGRVAILLNRGDAHFETAQVVPVSDAPRSLHLADLNKDGATDIVTGRSLGGLGVSVLIGHGNGAFQPSYRLRPNMGAGIRNLQITDIDDDGDDDIVATSSRTLNILHNRLE